jgi:hypothetical protein
MMVLERFSVIIPTSDVVVSWISNVHFVTFEFIAGSGIAKTGLG